MRKFMISVFCLSACGPAPDRREARLEAAEALIEQCAETFDPQSAARLGPLVRSDGPDLYAHAWLIDADIACYDGALAPGAAAWFDALETPLTTLVIRSEGGSGQDGVIIAERLAEWGAELVVRDACYSACASYPFMGAAHRTVPRAGIVGWHQGLAWTRYEALQSPEALREPGMGPVTRHAIRRFNQTGRNDVPDAVWRTLPETVRGTLDAQPSWRLRIERLQNHAGIAEGFSSAHTLVRARAPDFVSVAMPALQDGASLFWTPGEDELRRWGFSGLVMWDGDPQTVLALGLEASPPTVNVRMPIPPGAVPVRPDPSWQDDSADWPVYTVPD